MQGVPRVPPFDRAATYDDLVRLPENVVAEIVDGELHASPRSTPRHATAGAAVTTILAGPLDLYRPGPGGWRILYEPELHFGHDVLVPDVAGWRRERMPRLPDVAFFTLAPDWVCEILSPSTAALDRERKLAIYAREGVPDAWLIDPIGRTLEALHLESGRWSVLATYLGDDAVRADPFTGVEFRLSMVWGEE